MKTRNILIFIRWFIESIHFFLLMKISTFQKKSTAGEYTKEGKNNCPPSKIIYMKYLLGHTFFILWFTDFFLTKSKSEEGKK